MSKIRNLLALLLALAMMLALLAGCGDKTGSDPGLAEPSETAGAVEEAAHVRNTLVIAVDQGLEGKFSPFFGLSAADIEICDMTQVYTFVVDRVSNPVLEGSQGETRNYQGRDYTYYCASDLTVTENSDGTVYYDLTMREDIHFSDGTLATIDDVIFGIYVYLDPTYDGSSTLCSLPIEGLEAYRSGMEPLYHLLIEAGEDNQDFTRWTRETQEDFWEQSLPEAGAAFAQSIVDYCIARGYNDSSDSVAACAANWGYALAEDATALDFWNTILNAHDGDYAAASREEAATDPLWSFLDDAYRLGVETGESAPNISGIRKTGDFSLRIVATEVDATMLYQMALPIAPMHYYGDSAKYDYENNRFGFDKGDLSTVKAKSSQPMGAGPYVFKEYANGTVNMEANPYYYRGEPKIKYLHYLESGEAEKVTGLLSGDIDIASPSYSTQVADLIARYNGDDPSLDGPVLTTRLMDFNGYGYIGINPGNVKVGEDPASWESRCLRKAIATILAVYREEAVAAYYGETASVIDYPISNTSWAAPQVTEDGYAVAYCLDVSGEPIYTEDMEETYDAALEAALGYFEAAGYTVEDGRLTQAPPGAKLEYQAIFSGGGQGDHPAFLLLKNAADALSSIGFTLSLKDMTNASDLYAAYQTGVAELWCAAWGAASDPDMYQFYHSEGSTNYYQIADQELDSLIESARKSTDQSYRKRLYQDAMEIIMDWGVEVPFYQRSEAYVISSERVDVSTLPEDMTPYWGWAAEVEQIELK